jgi:undecaprenyl-diphosphatase
LVKHPQALTDNPMPIVVGFVISFVIALASIHWLLRYVARHDFRAFGWYRLGAGLVLAALVALKVVG